MNNTNKKASCASRGKVCEGGFCYSNIGEHCIVCGSVITAAMWRWAQGLDDTFDEEDTSQEQELDGIDSDEVLNPMYGIGGQPGQHRIPIADVLQNALLERGWSRLEGVEENESGEVREWAHPNLDRHITLVAAFWRQDTWDCKGVK